MNIGACVQFAIETEATARKAGNVHSTARFHDMSHEHFMIAARAIGEAVDGSIDASVGKMIEAATRAMLTEVGCNTSLGTILLICPLAKCAEVHGTLTVHTVGLVLQQLNNLDAESIYAAIRECRPGGLGTSESMSVHSAPPSSILEAMQYAADRDDVALQYANGFEQVFGMANRLDQLVEQALSIHDVVRCLQVEVLAARPDSLIRRKLGADAAENAQALANVVLEAGPFASAEYEAAWGRLDRELRSDGNRMNPGTTADLIAAALFAQRRRTRHTRVATAK